MAIPFNFPDDDETLAHYRRLYMMLVEITGVLRTAVAQNPNWRRDDAENLQNAANNNNNINNNYNYNNNNTNNRSSSSDRVNNTPHDCVDPRHSFPVAAGRYQPNPALPLSPPNSQPGSPSLGSATSFVLPDVVSAAARTLHDIAFPNLLPTNVAPAARVPPTASSNAPAAGFTRRRTTRNIRAGEEANDENNANLLPCRLRRERKRKGPAARKHKPHALDLSAARRSSSSSSNDSPTAPRKIARTAYDNLSVCSSCSNSYAPAGAAEDVPDGVAPMDQDVHQHQQQQAFFPDVPTADECDRCGRPQFGDRGNQLPLCIYVGEEFRKVVESYHRQKRNCGSISSTSSIASNEKSNYGYHRDADESGFFVHVGRTMLTAVIIVFGLRYLSKSN